MQTKLSGTLSPTVAESLARMAPKVGPKAKRPKYGNRKVMVDGILFDSKREAKRWVDLKLMESGGCITDLQRQVTFPLIVNGVKVTTYRADFVYWATEGKVVEDAKGYADRRWPMVKKLMKACYGIKIQEV